MKKRLFHFIFLMVILSAALLMIYLTLNGKIVSQGFPLKEKWIINLDSRVEALSSNGDQIIFARTGNGLYALDELSGEVLWQNKLAWQGIPRPPIVSDGIVFLADGKAVWAFNQQNGDVEWKYEVPLSTASVDFVSENNVIVEMSSSIYVFDAVEGTILWSKTECRYGEIQTYMDDFYIYSPCIDGLTIINRSTGTVEAEIEIPFDIATVAYQDGVMYYALDRDSISALELKNQSVFWKTNIEAGGFLKLKILGKYLLLTGSDKICTFHLENGEQVWCSEFSKPQNPTFIGPNLYIFNGYQNKITAFDMASGKRVGELSILGIKLLAVERELMVTSTDSLVFANGSTVVSFGE